MAPEKYLVRLVRPVFQTAYLEVEGSYEGDAAETALAMAAGLSEEAWCGNYNPELYDYDVHCVRTGTTADGHDFSLLDFPQYGLLSSDEDPPIGLTATQPWMRWQQPFALTRLFSKWVDLLKEDSRFYFDAGIDLLEEIGKVWRQTDRKVVPLKHPEERKEDIEILQATLDVAYVLKELD